MPRIERILAGEVKAARGFAAVVLTGLRRSGKTTLLRELFPDATHRLLEEPNVIGRIRADPQQPVAKVIRAASGHDPETRRRGRLR